MQIDAEKVPEAAEQFEVEVVPTFIILKVRSVFVCLCNMWLTCPRVGAEQGRGG